MKKTGFLLTLIGFLFFLSAPAYSLIWTDTYKPDPWPLYMEAGGTNENHSFEFDITNEQTFEVDLNLLWNPLVYEDSFWSLLDLNAGGDIQMNLSATSGDFYFWGAKITAADHQVPEPATMLLLGFGLLGIAGFGRKKFLKK